MGHMTHNAKNFDIKKGYRLELVKHQLLTLSVSRATIDGVNDARFL